MPVISYKWKLIP